MNSRRDRSVWQLGHFTLFEPRIYESKLTDGNGAPGLAKW
jgi:hypothetical protein